MVSDKIWSIRKKAENIFSSDFERLDCVCYGEMKQTNIFFQDHNVFRIEFDTIFITTRIII